MQRVRSMLVLLLGAWGLACGGSSTSVEDPNTSTGSGRTVTATYNGVAFTPTLMTSAYLGGQVSVNASDNTRNLSLSANNVTATGRYAVGPGNPNSAIAQWVDGVGIYSSQGSGGGGTVTFTVLQLGRVAGSFDNIIMRNTLTAGSTGTITLSGTFDIKFP